jgi:uncharacterized protein
MSSESETGELSGEAGARRQASAAAAVIADPAALGLAGFAATTMVLSCFNAGFLPSSGEKVVLPLALFYGGLAQLLAGMWEFRKGNTFGATAFSSYAAFWISFAAYVQFVVPALGGTSAAAPYTGLYLLAWTIFTAYMAIASLRTNVAIAAVLVLLFVTFLLLTLGEFGISALATVGGYLGLATALAAWYASAAVVTNETWGRVVLPVGARS